jgi:hypothetical protein
VTKKKDIRRPGFTARGFAVSEFTDFYGSKCSVQESSIVFPECIWLGTDVPHDIGRTVPYPYRAGEQTRMHLTRKMVKELIPLLQKFVETGRLR